MSQHVSTVDGAWSISKSAIRGATVSKVPAVEASRLELERPTATGLEYLECLDYDSFVKWLSWKLKKPQEIKYISWKGVQTSSGTRNLLQRRLHHKFDDWKTMTNSNSSNKNTNLSNSATQQPFPIPELADFMQISYGFSCLSILAFWAAASYLHEQS